MAENSLISWTDYTFNGWTGCMEVSVGPKGACSGCYARTLVEKRMGWATFGGPGRGVGTRARTSEAYWDKPRLWDKKAAKEGARPFVFCSSLADVFDNAVDPQWRADLFAVIRATPHLVWLLLTKRPGNIVEMCEAAGGLPSNAAIGCTIVTQAEADRDLPKLLLAQAALKPLFVFVSMEPLMERVDIRWALTRNRLELGAGLLARGHFDPGLEKIMGLDWVITGGESSQPGHPARPSNPDWFRDLRDQCADAEVAFHHKQNGEWVEVRAGDMPTGSRPVGGLVQLVEVAGGARRITATMRRVGKSTAGRKLDGRTHDDRPSIAA